MAVVVAVGAIGCWLASARDGGGQHGGRRRGRAHPARDRAAQAGRRSRRARRARARLRHRAQPARRRAARLRRAGARPVAAGRGSTCARRSARQGRPVDSQEPRDRRRGAAPRSAPTSGASRSTAAQPGAQVTRQRTARRLDAAAPTPCRSAAGPVDIEVRAAGYAPALKTMNVAAGEFARVPFTLQPVARRAPCRPRSRRRSHAAIRGPATRSPPTRFRRPAPRRAC